MNLYHSIIQQMHFGYARHEIILDSQGKPVDYRFLETNPAFEQLTGLKNPEIINKTVREVLPDITTSAFDWIGFYGKIAREGGDEVFEKYYEPFDKWYHIQVFSVEKGYFTTIIKEITDRKKAEIQINHSKHLLQYVVEHTNSAVAVHDKDLKYLYVSQRYLRDFNVKETDLIGKHHYEVFPDLPQKWRDVHQKALSGEVSSAEDDPYYREDGTVEWTRWECRPWHEADGEIGGIIVYTEVITKRKQAELELKKTADQLHLILEHSGDGMFAVDLEGKATMVNKAALKMLGYQENELLGKVMHDFHHHTKNDGTAYPNSECAIYQAFKEGKSNTVGDESFWRKDQSSFPVEYVSTPIIQDGLVTGAVVSFRDITAQQRAELIKQAQYKIAHAFITAKGIDDLFESICKELNSVVDTKNLLIAYYDEESDSFTAPFDVDSKTQTPQSWPAKDSLTGIVAREKKTLLLKKSDVKKLFERGRIALRGERAETWLGLPMIINDRVIGVLVLQSYDDPNAFSETDIHMLEILANEMSIYIQKKRNEEALLLAKEKAEESDRLKTAFLENVSHEIRTPMNSILGFLDLLKEPRLDDLLKTDYIDIVNKSAQRLLSTITDIVELSKLESGQPEVHFQDVDINKLMHEQFNLFKTEAQLKGLELRFVEDCFCDSQFLFTDKQKLTSVIRNIINNAIKFTKEGYVELGNYLENEKLVVYVRDTGPGIPFNKQEAIFERFVQGDHKVTRGYEGSGLGLTIARKYIELLNGKIWLESELGHGSVFYFSIPASHALLEKVPAEKADLSTSRKLSNSTILIAEDDDMSFLLLETILEDQNLNILRAVTGEEAISLLKAHPETSLILMDLKMPGMGGLAATQAIREFNTSIPIIAQTAHALMGDKSKAMEYGCNDYISKPINRKDLFKMLDNYIGRAV